jgi:hypothetical protein
LRTTWSWVLIGASVVLLVVPVASLPAVAQGGGATIHIVLGGGPWQGEHDAVIEEPCQADVVGPGTWEIAGSSDSPLTGISVVVAEGQNHLVLTFIDADTGVYTDYQSTYGSDEIVFDVEDRGATATLTGKGEVFETSPDQAVSVDITVECLSVEPAGRSSSGPAPEPTPVALGSPPPGAATFHVEIGSGPHAGSYDVWTLDDGCLHAEDDSWIAQYWDRTTAPATITFVAAQDEMDGSMLGLIEVGFRAEDGTDAYLDSEPLIEISGDPSSATLSITSTSATAPAWTGEDAQQVVDLAVTIQCQEDER